MTFSLDKPSSDHVKMKQMLHLQSSSPTSRRAVLGGMLAVGATPAFSATSPVRTSNAEIPVEQRLEYLAAEIAKKANRRTVSLKDEPFNAVGDGKTDDTDAIQRWASTAGENIVLEASAGVYRFTRAITFPDANEVTVRGAGKYSTIFLYDGQDRTSHLFTIGDGKHAYRNSSVRGIGFSSVSVLTGGSALRIRRMQTGSDVSDVAFGQLGSVPTLFDGIWFDNVNVARYTDAEHHVRRTAFACNGSSTTDEGSDIYLDALTAVGGETGYHIGGGIGGVYAAAALAFGCGVGFRIDNALCSRFNRELLFSKFCVSDGSREDGFVIDDPLAGGCNILLDAMVGSSRRHAIHILRYPNSRITVGGGQIFNAGGDGIHGEDSSTLLTTSSETQITNNKGWGVFWSVPTTLVRIDAWVDESNKSGRIHNNINEWISHDVLLKSTGGKIINYKAKIKERRKGSTIFYNIKINIIENGNGKGKISVYLPNKAKETSVFYGSSQDSGRAVIGIVSENTNILVITRYDGMYPGMDNDHIHLSGIVESFT